MSRLHDELPAEVRLNGIGDARAIGLPRELFVELGLTNQHGAPFTRAFVMERTNGCLPGFACTTQAYSEGGYETGESLLTGRSGV